MKSFDKFYSAQTILEEIYGDNINGAMIGGFNHKLQGYDYSDFIQNSDHRQMAPYYDLAEKMIEEGKIFFVHPFECSCGYVRFYYGGGWACNTCNTCITTPEWWKIKVFKDGDSWICIGDGFTNLQESNNYAFGASRKESIDNYGLIFTSKPV